MVTLSPQFRLEKPAMCALQVAMVVRLQGAKCKLHATQKENAYFVATLDHRYYRLRNQDWKHNFLRGTS